MYRCIWREAGDSQDQDRRKLMHQHVIVIGENNDFKSNDLPFAPATKGKASYTSHVSQESRTMALFQINMSVYMHSGPAEDRGYQSLMQTSEQPTFHTLLPRHCSLQDQEKSSAPWVSLSSNAISRTIGVSHDYWPSYTHNRSRSELPSIVLIHTREPS